MGDGSNFSLGQINGILEKIGPIADKVQNVANSIGSGNMGSESPAQITTRNNNYKDAYDNAKTTYGESAMKLSQAEKNYIAYNEGKPGGIQLYDAIIIDRFATTAATFRTNSIELQQQFMADLSQSLRQYQAEMTFLAQSQKLLTARKAEQTDIIKNINYYEKVVQTSERKVVYENKNMDSLYTYRRVMIFFYYAVVIAYIVFGNFVPDKLFLNYTVWLIVVIVCIIPIILNIVVKWIFIFYDIISYWFGDLPHRDVYLKLGNPGDEKPPDAPNLLSSLVVGNSATSLSGITSQMSSLIGKT